MLDLQHGGDAVSPWVRRWSHLVPEQASVLDVACGRGRHLRWFASRGNPVVGVDRSEDAVASLADLVAAGNTQVLLADIENRPWPLLQGPLPRQFDAVVVTNYLWRPLLPTLIQSVAPAGVLIYETFSQGNSTVGKPSRPDFLLAPGELLALCSGLHVVAYEDGFCEHPARFIQRVVAARPNASHSPGAMPVRYPL